MREWISGYSISSAGTSICSKELHYILRTLLNSPTNTQWEGEDPSKFSFPGAGEKTGDVIYSTHHQSATFAN